MIFKNTSVLFESDCLLTKPTLSLLIGFVNNRVMSTTTLPTMNDNFSCRENYVEVNMKKHFLKLMPFFKSILRALTYPRINPGL